MNDTPKNFYRVDATGQSLGRLASDIAMHLRDKHLPTFSPNEPGTTIVEVKNIEALKITGNKLNANIRYRHSGYPGGLKETVWKDQFGSDPAAFLRKTVAGMLPDNRLRADALKRLIIKTTE